MPRFSASPELLKIGGATYTPASFNATTFLILGEVVVHSREFHVTIIHGLMAMSSAKDLNTARCYNVKFSSRLSQEDLVAFNETWVGNLSAVRIHNKAGRVWKNVVTDQGETVSVISFWGEKKSITSSDLGLLRRTFGLVTKVIVEYQGSKRSLLLPALAE